MTTPKGVIPTGSKLLPEKNRWFEALALAELQRLPTAAWENMDALWRMLPLAHPATRRRILTRCLQLAQERSDCLSAKFVRRFAGHAIREFGVSRVSRARVHDEKAFREAARHLAHNPNASLGDLATAASAKKGTVRQWLPRADFKAFLNDENFLIELDRAQRASLEAERSRASKGQKYKRGTRKR